MTYHHRTWEEQAIIDKLWKNKCAFRPYVAYCTTTEPLTMQRWTGRWENDKPVMKDVPVAKGQTLKIVMMSRLGDFGLTDDLNADHGYDIRLDWDSPQITNLREKP